MTRYVAYLLSPSKRARSISGTEEYFNTLQSQVDEFMSRTAGGELINCVQETGQTKRNRRQWPGLEEAIAACKTQKAQLLLVQFKKVITNPHFVQLINQYLGKHRISSEYPFIQEPQFVQNIVCCDYPSINRENFLAIVDHECRQREEHRRRILNGLKKPTAKKSGNPNAAQVISMVNWPKTNSAIIFALHLQPVIDEYQKKGFSQRKMVQMLNSSGIHAPEGGYWVLSQLQKVLDRIKINQAAIMIESTVSSGSHGTEGDSDLIGRLNQAKISPPKGKEWTDEMVTKVTNRLKQFEEIVTFNKFVLAAKPYLEQTDTRNLDTTKIIEEIQSKGVEIPPILKRIAN